MAVLAIVNDARRRRLVPCYDFGLYCWVSFPLTVTWYCLWSRKWRGLLHIGGDLPTLVRTVSVGDGFLVAQVRPIAIALIANFRATHPLNIN
jgi:hypothetical protein